MVSAQPETAKFIVRSPHSHRRGAGQRLGQGVFVSVKARHLAASPAQKFLGSLRHLMADNGDPGCQLGFGEGKNRQ